MTTANRGILLLRQVDHLTGLAKQTAPDAPHLQTPDSHSSEYPDQLGSVVYHHHRQHIFVLNQMSDYR